MGEFYETIGIDAVLLVQHAGLNPMGSGVTPRAGCPRQNLRRTVDDLVSAGLSVVVCEEVGRSGVVAGGRGWVIGWRGGGRWRVVATPPTHPPACLPACPACPPALPALPPGT